MILGRDYVILNYPKTGTTYLRELLTYERWSLRVLRKWTGLGRRLPERRWFAHFMDHSVDWRWLKPTEHGLRMQIPVSHASLPLYAVRRNPLDYAISRFHFADWKKRRLDFALRPELSDFSTWLRASHAENYFANHPWNADWNPAVGSFDVAFIMLFAKDPFSLLRKPLDEIVENMKAECEGITFLNQETLKADAITFAKKYGTYLSPQIISKRMNVSRPSGKPLTEYYSLDLLDVVEDLFQVQYACWPEYKENLEELRRELREIGK